GQVSRWPRGPFRGGHEQFSKVCAGPRDAARLGKAKHAGEVLCDHPGSRNEPATWVARNRQDPRPVVLPELPFSEVLKNGDACPLNSKVLSPFFRTSQ